MIGKAEITGGKDTPWFLVTNLSHEGFDGDTDSTRFWPWECYEQRYCARGGNRIEEQQLEQLGRQTSTSYLASGDTAVVVQRVGLLLIERFWTLTLRGTELATATAGAIRDRLLKVGVLVR